MRQYLADLYTGEIDTTGSGYDEAAILPVSPVIKMLISRFKLGDKAAGAALKTAMKFAKEKIGGEPYWKTGELVPTNLAKAMREVNRNTLPKYTGHVASVLDYIMQQGIDDMGIMSYHPERQKAHLSEGNTRTTIADNLDIPYVPLRGYRSYRDPYQGTGISVPQPFQERTPAEFKPSDLGFDVYNTDELVDIYLKSIGKKRN